MVFAWIDPSHILTIHDCTNWFTQKGWPLKTKDLSGFNTLSLHLWLPEAFGLHRAAVAASKLYMHGGNVLFSNDRL